MLCNWSTYKGTYCKKFIDDDNKFCTLHSEIMSKYSKLNSDDLCETFKEIKIVPRTYNFLKNILLENNNEDDYIQVIVGTGGLIEDADISDKDYIKLLSDNSIYYYFPKKDQKKTKNLKVIFNQYCKNIACIEFNDKKYCEECFKKLKDVPKISLV